MAGVAKIRWLIKTWDESENWKKLQFLVISEILFSKGAHLRFQSTAKLHPKLLWLSGNAKDSFLMLNMKGRCSVFKNEAVMVFQSPMILCTTMDWNLWFHRRLLKVQTNITLSWKFHYSNTQNGFVWKWWTCVST